jgi:hypothetical protein
VDIDDGVAATDGRRWNVNRRGGATPTTATRGRVRERVEGHGGDAAVRLPLLENGAA